MPRYRYVIEEDAATGLLSVEDSQIRRLIAAIEALAADPKGRPDSYSLDAQGRPLANKISGNFLIGYWFEHPAHRLHILRIDPLTSE